MFRIWELILAQVENLTTINNQEETRRLLPALSDNPQRKETVRARILGDELLQLPARSDAFVAQMTDLAAEQKQFNATISATVKEIRDYLKSWRGTQPAIPAKAGIYGLWQQMRITSYRILGSRFRGNDGNSRLEIDIHKLTTLPKGRASRSTR